MTLIFSLYLFETLFFIVLLCVKTVSHNLIKLSKTQKSVWLPSFPRGTKLWIVQNIFQPVSLALITFSIKTSADFILFESYILVNLCRCRILQLFVGG